MSQLRWIPKLKIYSLSSTYPIWYPDILVSFKILRQFSLVSGIFHSQTNILYLKREVTWSEENRYKWFIDKAMAQSAGAVKYTDCFSAEG